MITAKRNQYFVCEGNGQAPIAWNPLSNQQRINLHTDYFGKAFQEMEKRLDGSGWTIYLTSDIHRLPSYGPHVVAVVMGDEWGRIPFYAHRIGALFKCYGIRSRPKPKLLGNNWHFQVLVWLKYFYGLLKFLAGWTFYSTMTATRRLRGQSLPAMHAIPLGYANQIEVPFVPFEKRKLDVSFAGSILHKAYPFWSLKRWIGTPKRLSRKQLLLALEAFQDRQSDKRVDLKITPSFRAIRRENPAIYATRLMNTRISVVPRGNALETFRFFEALRAGCVLITEDLPDFWFYYGAPVIRLADWSRLPDVLEDLMSDADKLERLHLQSMGWWRDVCAPDALGIYLAKQLNKLKSGATLRKPDRKPIPLRTLQRISSEVKNNIPN